MDTFHGTRQGHGIANISAASFSGGKGEDGPYAFAACKQAVTHCLMECGRFGAGGGKMLAERAVHQLGPLAGIFFEIKWAVNRHAGVLKPERRGGNADFLLAPSAGACIFAPLK